MKIPDKIISKEEKQSFIKTRIESLGLLKSTKYKLISNNIVTVGGLINRSELEIMRDLDILETEILAIRHSLNLLVPKIINDSSMEKTKIRKLNSYEIEDLIKAQEIDEKLLFQKIETVGFYNDEVMTFLIKQFNIPKNVLIGKSRKKNIVLVRDMIVYILRKFYDLSYPEIGRIMGGRDHATIIHSYNKIKKKISANHAFNQEFNKIIVELLKFKEKSKSRILNELKNALEKNPPKNNFKKVFEKIEIPERNIKILNLYREGLVLENIGKKINISRERVRQIVKKTVEQIAYNRSIETGNEVKYLDLFEEERQIREKSKIKRRPPKVIKKPKKYKWSRYYDNCIQCKKTSNPHFKQGLCEVCGNKSISGHAREKMVADHNNKCDICKIPRDESRLKFKIDFYISRKDNSVLCKKCFLKKRGQLLGDDKRNRWRMFYN